MEEKSSERLVMYMSSSCNGPRDQMVRGLIDAGIDVWYVENAYRCVNFATYSALGLSRRSFGSCVTEHEKTNRTQQLREICGDNKQRHTREWRLPKACIANHFKVTWYRRTILLRELL